MIRAFVKSPKKAPNHYPEYFVFGWIKHTGRNCFNPFQISSSANTADAHQGVSGVSKDQKFCEKFKNTHCQVDHPAKME